jgi:hypothetical protein
MAYRYFRGETMDEENPDKPLMVKVTATIGSCFDYPDDAVQLQIIKVGKFPIRRIYDILGLFYGCHGANLRDSRQFIDERYSHYL